MNKSIWKFLSFVIALNLVFVSFFGIVPQRVFADAQNIEVTPYPQTAGERASYRVSFNINKPMTKGIDSFRVIFPLSTTIDSSIASANISVNPDRLDGANCIVDYDTGRVTFLDPLCTGDRITANYRYEAPPEYSQIPRNIKFDDLVYADSRRDNGLLDAGERVYEDRDNDGMISFGDKRLVVVVGGTGPTTYRQCSLVGMGDIDAGYGTGGTGLPTTPINPLTTFSTTRIMFVDNDSNGKFNENDWVIDDKNLSGTLDFGDVLITGLFWYTRNSVVTLNDRDVNWAVGPLNTAQTFPIPPSPPSLSNIRHAENIKTNALFEDGEFVYADMDNNNQVSVDDYRLTWVYRNCAVYPRFSKVLSNLEKDHGMILVNFNGVIPNTSTPNEMTVQNTLLDRNYLLSRTLPSGPVPVSPGDKRINNILMSRYDIDSLVGTDEADSNIVPFLFTTDEKFAGASVGLATPVFNTFDPIYRDNDVSGKVSQGDTRLTEFRIYVDQEEIIYSAGSTVRKGEVDEVGGGLVLANFPPTVRHTEIGTPNYIYDPGEMIYSGVSTTTILTNGSYRQKAYGVVSGNTVIRQNYPDTGLSLTRGWADITNEEISAYASSGERIAQQNLSQKPILKPIVPPINDVNYSLQSLTMPSAICDCSLKGKGRIFYSITAITFPNFESKPWDEKYVDFNSNSTNNAVRIKWSALQYAYQYKIYRTDKDGSYGENSLVATVSAPLTEYIDLGCEGLPGQPPKKNSGCGTCDDKKPVCNPFICIEKNGKILFVPETSDYSLVPSTGCMTFNRSLKLYDTIIADYDVGVTVPEISLSGGKPAGSEIVYVDPVLGRAQLRNKHIIDPTVYCDDLYQVKIWKHTAANYNDPTRLVPGVDYDFLDEKNDKARGLDEGMIVFKITVDPTDTITASYIYRKEIRGDLLRVATGNEPTVCTNEKPILPGTARVFKGTTLSSAPKINVVRSDRGFLIEFTTPKDISVTESNKNSGADPIPGSCRDVCITFSRQTGITNPQTIGNYQVFTRTSIEQTDMLSNPYKIIPNYASQAIVQLTKDQNASAGFPIALTSGVQDKYGNKISNVYVSYAVQVSPNAGGKLDKSIFLTDQSGTAVAMFTTSATPGENIIKAKITQGLVTEVLFRIKGTTDVPINKITITPATATLAPNGSTQFMATGFDAEGKTVTVPKFAWSVTPVTLGTIDENGKFTASTAIGSGTITAEAYGIKGTASITITQSSTKVEKVVVTPATVSTNVSKTVQFTAKAYDGLNVEVPNVTITWTVTPVEIGTISSLGLFTAKSIGTGVIMANTQDGKSAIAVVTVLASIARIAISPETATMNVGEVKQFMGIVYDENNQPVNNPAITWTVRGDIGIVTNTGIFTASRKGIGQVVASIDGKEAAAVVTVNDTNTDKEGPIITIMAPSQNYSTADPSIVVQGNAKDVSGVRSVKINGINAANFLSTTGDFTSQIIQLNSGNNSILVLAEDNLGNVSSKSINVIRVTPIIIKLRIGDRNAIVIKDGMPNFVTIDLAPFTRNGRTLVPLRFISEAFGANVVWNPDVSSSGEGEIVITVDKKNGTRIVIRMHTGSKFMTKKVWAPGSNQPIEEPMNYDQNDPAPYVVKPQGRTVVPLRFLGESIGATFDWKPETQEIQIQYVP